MLCPSCQKPVPDGAEKCPHCGHPILENTAEKAADAVSAQKENYQTAVPEKRTLYKAAQVEPERPVRRIDDAEKPEKPVRRRAPAVTAAIWIVAIALVVGLAFGIGAILSGRNDPDTTQADNTDPGAETEADVPERTAGSTVETQPEPTPEPAAEPKPVYELRGTWRWESEQDGYRDTYWVFSAAGKLDIYLVGEAYAYAWPQTYDYDKKSYVLSLTDAAMGLAWLDEDTFVCGAGTAYRADTGEIPADAVNVRQLDAPPAPEEDPYLLPESASRYMTTEDLENLSKEQLRFARNEIFARHGRLFTDEELQNYFNEQSWYNGYIKPQNFDSSVLNDYERYNVAFIGKYEDRLG